MNTFKKLSLIAGLIIPCSVFAAAGDLDVTFSGDGIVQVPAQTSARRGAVQADGKIVVVGTGINAVNGLDNHMVARYLPNGDLDTSFGSNGVVITNVPVGGAWENWAVAVAIQQDGKIVVGGGVYLPAGNDDFTVTRYNPNGSLDTSFGVSGAQRIDFGYTESDVISDMKLQADGKIVLVGTSYIPASGNTPSKRVFSLARLTTSGTLDTTFSGDGRQTTAMATNNDSTNAYAVAIQADGKIVVVGNAWMGTTPRNDIAVARYLSNGNLDTTFDGDGKAYVRFGNLDDYASGVSIQTDGKIVIAGSVNTDCCGGLSDLGLARLTTAGKLDTTFDGDGKLLTPFLSYEYASDVIALGNGKIMATGGYKRADGQYSAVMTRYNTSGSLDATFSGDGKAERATVSNLYPAMTIDGSGNIVTVTGYDVARYLSQ